MFKSITINMTAPICTCSRENLNWGIEDELTLVLECETCGNKIIIPQQKFIAHFVFEQNYPEERQEAKILRLVKKDEKED